MKRIITFLLTAALLFALAACAGNTPANIEENGSTTASNEISVSDETSQETEISEPSVSAEPETEQDAEEVTPDVETTPETDTDTENKKVLVVVFSATGTTKGVAEKIAKIENADIYEIKAAQEYTSADLNWNDSSSRSTKEQNDPSSRPEIGSERISLEGYETIYIGFPIWWGEEPRIMDTFVESYDFDGITMIPFCTSSSSGIGRSGKNLEEKAKSGNWLDGKRFPGSVSESDLESWIDGLNR
jgi:flavodoxin